MATKAAKRDPIKKAGKVPKPKTGGAQEEPQLQVSGSALPRRSLEDSLIVVHKLRDIYAGKSATIDELASALAMSKTNNNFKYIVWSAASYGLINVENENPKTYSLSETGRKIVAETYPGESQEAKTKAVLTPTILSQFFTDYNNSTLPSDEHFANVLENRYHVPRDRTAEAIKLIIQNGIFSSILSSGGAEGALLVTLKGAPPGSEAVKETDPAPKETATRTVVNEGSPKQQISWEKTCFYITPLGEGTSEERKHADMMLKHLLEPVFTALDFVVVRADEIAKSGIITSQILEHIAKSRLCVADLSFRNPNAFYELGVRHAFLLPTIQIIHKTDKIPFDVSQGRTITIDTADRYTIMDRLESARKELKEYVTNLLQDAGSEVNPVAVYLPGAKVILPK